MPDLIDISAYSQEENKQVNQPKPKAVYTEKDTDADWKRTLEQRLKDIESIVNELNDRFFPKITGNTEQDILYILGEHPAGLRFCELERILSMHPESLTNKLYRLRRDRAIVKDGNRQGRYRLLL